MFGISKMWVYGIAALALVLALGAGARHFYNSGYESRDAKAVKEAVAAQKRADDEKAALVGEVDSLRSKSDQEKQHAKMEIDSLRTQLNSGAIRLSVPATSRVVRGPAPARGEARAQPGEAPVVRAPDQPGSVVTTVTVELDPSTSVELLSIAADGDAAIRDLNECIDQYELLRKKLHALSTRTN